jgi:nucleoside-diphosphate-sugar epimerase
VRQLLAIGEPVVGIDRAALTPHPGLTVLTADLCNRDDWVTATLADADAVFHLAGCPGVRDPRSAIDTLRHRDNVLAAAVVLESVPAGTLLVVTSSSSVYGGARFGRASRERDRLRPRRLCASKVAVERLCRQRIATGGRIVIARPFTVAGEGPAARHGTGPVDRRSPIRPTVAVTRLTVQTRDITDAQHVVRALVALAGSSAQGPVNVGTGRGHSLARMVAAVADALQVRSVPKWSRPARPSAGHAGRHHQLRRLIGWVRDRSNQLVARQVTAGVADPVLVGVA